MAIRAGLTIPIKANDPGATNWGKAVGGSGWRILTSGLNSFSGSP